MGGGENHLMMRGDSSTATTTTRIVSDMGRTIVREIVLALGGTIQLNNRLQSETNEGLDTCVWLPLQTTDDTH